MIAFSSNCHCSIISWNAPVEHNSLVDTTVIQIFRVASLFQTFKKPEATCILGLLNTVRAYNMAFVIIVGSYASYQTCMLVGSDQVHVVVLKKPFFIILCYIRYGDKPDDYTALKL